LRKNPIPLKRTEKSKIAIRTNAGDVALNLASINLPPGVTGGLKINEFKVSKNTKYSKIIPKITYIETIYHFFSGNKMCAVMNIANTKGMGTHI
jgi:hypothetical protein